MSKLVLIAEDRPELRTLVNITLSSDGYDIIECSTAHEVMNVALDKNPHLILMDIDMPGEYDGIEATRMLSKHPDSTSPVIMLTAARDKADAASKAGAVAYLTKPFSPIELLQCVQQHVRKD